MVIRLQNLSEQASAPDVRRFFVGLAIPDGGVHIVGGVEGDAFITFSSDEDARQAMQRDGQPLVDRPVRLSLSSRSEMQRTIQLLTRRAAAQPLTPTSSASTVLSAAASGSVSPPGSGVSQSVLAAVLSQLAKSNATGGSQTLGGATVGGGNPSVAPAAAAAAATQAHNTSTNISAINAALANIVSFFSGPPAASASSKAGPPSSEPQPQSEPFSQREAQPAAPPLAPQPAVASLPAPPPPPAPVPVPLPMPGAARAGSYAPGPGPGPTPAQSDGPVPYSVAPSTHSQAQVPAPPQSQPAIGMGMGMGMMHEHYPFGDIRTHAHSHAQTTSTHYPMRPSSPASFEQMNAAAPPQMPPPPGPPPPGSGPGSYPPPPFFEHHMMPPGPSGPGSGPSMPPPSIAQPPYGPPPVSAPGDMPLPFGDAPFRPFMPPAPMGERFRPPFPPPQYSSSVGPGAPMIGQVPASGPGPGGNVGMPPMGPMTGIGPGPGPGPGQGQGPGLGPGRAPTPGAGAGAGDEGHFVRLTNVHYQLNVRELLRFLRAVRVHEGGVRMVEERGAPTLPNGRRRRTGTAYVHVPSWADLQSALELNGASLRDRQVSVEQCSPDEYYNEGVLQPHLTPSASASAFCPQIRVESLRALLINHTQIHSFIHAFYCVQRGSMGSCPSARRHPLRLYRLRPPALIPGPACWTVRDRCNRSSISRFRLRLHSSACIPPAGHLLAGHLLVLVLVLVLAVARRLHSKGQTGLKRGHHLGLRSALQIFL